MFNGKFLVWTGKKFSTKEFDYGMDQLPDWTLAFSIFPLSHGNVNLPRSGSFYKWLCSIVDGPERSTLL